LENSVAELNKLVGNSFAELNKLVGNSFAELKGNTPYIYD
jgi:hypothetical protein